eukprot:g9936.t1
METCSVPILSSVELKESSCIVSIFITMSIVTKKKVENILSAGFDSPDFRKALDDVALFYGQGEEEDISDYYMEKKEGNAGDNAGVRQMEQNDRVVKGKEKKDGVIKNTIDERRNLRDNLQAQGLKNMEEFLKQFEGLRTRLEKINNTVNTLDETCLNIEKQLLHAEGTTSVFVIQSEKLREEHEEIIQRQELVDDFLTNYHLTKEELQLLRHEPLRESDGGSKFFETVEKLNRIRKNSSTFLSSVFQRASLETLEELTSVQEAVYARLYEWVKEYCENLGDGYSENKNFQSSSNSNNGGSPQGMIITRRALKILRERPEYYNECVQIVVKTRQIALRRRFIVALTRGSSGPNGNSRPIELHAHDVFRYLSDMLAWVHVSIATETDVLANLVENDDVDGDNDGKNDNNNSSNENIESSMLDNTYATVAYNRKNALSNIFNGLTRPLTSRITQSINQTHNMVSIFQIIDVLSFYLFTLRSLLSSSCKFVEGLENCSVKAQKHFRISLGKYANDIRENLPSFATNLSVVSPIVDSASKLKKMCAIHYQSIVPEEVKNSIFAEVLTSMIEPMRHICTVASQHLDDMDTAVFMLNNLNVIRLSISSYTFANKWCKSLEQQIVSWMETLVVYLVKSCLKRCNLIETLQIVKDVNSTMESMQKAGVATTGAISSVEGMDDETLNLKILKFNEELGSLDPIHLHKIDDSNLRKKARAMISKEMFEAYKMIFNALLNDGSYDMNKWYSLEKVKVVLGGVD